MTDSEKALLFLFVPGTRNATYTVVFLGLRPVAQRSSRHKELAIYVWCESTADRRTAEPCLAGSFTHIPY